MAKEPEKQIVRIWDDPESRIQFLETVLKNQNWEAVIYHPQMAENPSPDAPHPLANLQAELDERGYKTKLGVDDRGIPTLSLKNFGDDTKLVDAVKEKGLVKGVGYKLTHLNQPLGEAMANTRDYIKQMASDKARAIGAIYMVGDSILTLSGLGNKKKEGERGLNALKDPANALESVFGACAVVQSLIYMGFAKEGSTAMYDELMEKAADAEKNGQNMFDEALWQPEQKKFFRGPVTRIREGLESKPLQAGAVVQLMGKASMIASGGIRLKRVAEGTHGLSPEEEANQRKGAMFDIAAAVSSGTGWALLMKKPNEVDDAEKAPWSSPKRIWQEVQAAPNKFASAFLGTASVTSLLASREKDNTIQRWGNATYLAGDAIMFATKSGDYGSEGKFSPVVLADAAAKFVEASPMLMGQEEQAQFITQVSNYLAARAVNEVSRKEKRDPVDGEEVELSTHIQQALAAKLPTVHSRTYEVAGKAARILETFNPAFADGMADTIAEAICDVPSVMVDKEEMKKYMLQQVDQNKAASTDMIAMADVAEPIADLVFSIPGAADASVVNKLYEAVDDFIRPEPRKTEKLEEVINTKAEQDIGVPPSTHAGAVLASQQAQLNVDVPTR